MITKRVVSATLGMLNLILFALFSMAYHDLWLNNQNSVFAVSMMIVTGALTYVIAYNHGRLEEEYKNERKNTNKNS